MKEKNLLIGIINLITFKSDIKGKKNNNMKSNDIRKNIQESYRGKYFSFFQSVKILQIMSMPLHSILTYLFLFFKTQSHI